MDKYLYNKLRRLHRPGRGKQMKAEILQQFLVKALTERPKDLEIDDGLYNVAAQFEWLCHVFILLFKKILNKYMNFKELS